MLKNGLLFKWFLSAKTLGKCKFKYCCKNFAERTLNGCDLRRISICHLKEEKLLQHRGQQKKRVIKRISD